MKVYLLTGVITTASLVVAAAFAVDPAPSAADKVALKVEKEYQDVVLFDDEQMGEVERLRRELEEKTGEELAKIKNLNDRLIADKIFAVRGAYSQFLERHPNHIKALMAFASFLYDEGETETALQKWRKVLTFDPKNAAVHNHLGNHYGHTGDWNQALAEYEAALALRSSEPVFHFNYASVMDLFRKEVAVARGWSEAETTRRIVSELKTARDLAPQDFSYAKAYAQSLDSVTPPNLQESLAAWMVCLKLAEKTEEKDYVNANSARVCIELGDKQKAGDYIAAIALPSSEPMKQDLLQRLQKLK